VNHFRAQFGFSAAAAGVTNNSAPEGSRFVRVCDGRAIDGYRVCVAPRGAAPVYPEPVPSLPAADSAAAINALNDLKAWKSSTMPSGWPTARRGSSMKRRINLEWLDPVAGSSRRLCRVIGFLCFL
jgi:hypothetical protein